MIARPISFLPGTARRREDGFTLVELMVALLLSMLLAVAMLNMQTKMASQTMRVSDTGTRDTQTRAAMDLITRDLTSAGFLLGNSQYSCDAVFTYNSAAGFFAHHPADALPSVSGAKMNFAPSLTMNYPPAGGIVSDVLVTTSATSAAQFQDTTNPNLLADGTAGGTPLTTGVLPMSKLTNVKLDDTVIVQAPVGTSTTAATACLRVPVSSFAGLAIKSVNGTIMPASAYNPFVVPVAAAGFASPLTDVGLLNAYVVDIGTKANSTQVTTVYYIDGSGAFPVLMRAQYSLIDDTVIAPGPQPIAAGVVALRISFGVDPANTGAVAKYEEAPVVNAKNHWGVIRSARVALVTRTINDDPTADAGATPYAAPTTIPIGPPGSASSPAWFASITVPASTHRYIVNTTEVAYRNWLWRN